MSTAIVKLLSAYETSKFSTFYVPIVEMHAPLIGWGLKPGRRNRFGDVDAIVKLPSGFGPT